MQTDISKINNYIAKWINENNYTKELIIINPEISCNLKAIILSGKVLLEKQKKEIEKKLIETYQLEIINNLEVISSPFYCGNFEWGSAAKISNVRRNKGEEKISTQITPVDNYFKIIYKDKNESLIQLEDLTLGWIFNKEIVKQKVEGRRQKAEEKHNYWQNITRPCKDQIIEVPSLDLLFQAAQKYIDTPYLLGGKTEKGIDCSGLMQVVFKQAFNMILPKHALDQFKLGVRIPINKIQSGDLIFAKVKGKNIFHVGLVYKGRRQKIEIENQKDENNVIHASRHAKKVIIEPMADFLEKYVPSGARRIAVIENE